MRWLFFCGCAVCQQICFYLLLRNLKEKENLFVRNHLTVYTLLLPDAGSSHQGESLAEHVQYV